MVHWLSKFSVYTLSKWQWLRMLCSTLQCLILHRCHIDQGRQATRIYLISVMCFGSELSKASSKVEQTRSQWLVLSKLWANLQIQTILALFRSLWQGMVLSVKAAPSVPVSHSCGLIDWVERNSDRELLLPLLVLHGSDGLAIDRGKALFIASRLLGASLLRLQTQVDRLIDTTIDS